MRENDERDWLQALLEEDVGTDVDDFLTTVQQLRQWQVPQPTPEATRLLIAQLEVAVAEPPLTRWQRILNWWPWLLLRSQIRVVQAEIWLASVAVMALGTVVSILSYRPGDMLLPFVFIAPLISAFVVGLLFDGDMLHMLELEDTTPVSTRVLLLARLTLVFGFNLMLGVLGSVVLAVWNADLLLGPLIMTWLAPMTFLSALAFFVSVWVSDALAGGLLSLILWSGHIFLRLNPISPHFLQLLQMPGLSVPAFRPILLLVAVLLVTVALWLVGISDHRLQGAQP